MIIFIAVKARSDHEFGHPFDALTPIKQKKIIQTTQSFLVQKRIPDKSMWFDVGHLYWTKLLENAFQVSSLTSLIYLGMFERLRKKHF